MACNCGSSKNVRYTVTGANGEKFTGITTQSEANILAARTGGTIRKES